jgi:hypothetical protein
MSDLKNKELINELVKQLVLAIPAEEVADMAASQRAISYSFNGVIRDGVMPEIVVGHCVVIIAYGSEKAIANINRVLVEISEQG